MVQVMHNNCCKNVKEPVFHVEQKEHTPLKKRNTALFYSNSLIHPMHRVFTLKSIRSHFIFTVIIVHYRILSDKSTI